MICYKWYWNPFKNDDHGNKIHQIFNTSAMSHESMKIQIVIVNDRWLHNKIKDTVLLCCCCSHFRYPLYNHIQWDVIICIKCKWRASDHKIFFHSLSHNMKLLWASLLTKTIFKRRLIPVLAFFKPSKLVHKLKLTL